MAKIFKNPIFTFVLGALIFGGVGVAASEIFASSISFTPTNPDWVLTENTVEAAIDDLYNKSNSSKIIESDKSISKGNLAASRTVSKSLTKGKYIVSISYGHAYTTSAQQDRSFDDRITSVTCLNNNCEVSELVSDGYLKTANLYGGSNRNFLKMEHRLFFVNITQNDTINVTSSVNDDVNVPEILSVEYLKIK